jgi:guanine nucleotide-binding protein subunit alpha
MFDISSERSTRKKWIHQFEDSISIVFFVDLSQYDELLEKPDRNRIMESLLLFDSVVNSRWFFRASVILLLCNIGHFKEKLKSRPLSNYFPDYSGGNDFNRASKYLLWRFSQVSRGHLDLYPHFCEPSDYSNIRVVVGKVRETILINAVGLQV